MRRLAMAARKVASRATSSAMVLAPSRTPGSGVSGELVQMGEKGRGPEGVEAHVHLA
jgi:hypothetical protein